VLVISFKLVKFAVKEIERARTSGFNKPGTAVPVPFDVEDVEFLHLLREAGILCIRRATVVKEVSNCIKGKE
jgi:hypothetical protein